MIEGTFTRRSERSLQEVQALPAGWFMISYRWIEGVAARRKAHGRWYRLQSDHGRIYRNLMFLGSLKGTPRNREAQAEIVIDWQGWLDLAGRQPETEKALVLKITPAKWWEYPRMALTHPDPAYRLSVRLGLLSVGLGLLSLVQVFV